MDKKLSKYSSNIEPIFEEIKILIKDSKNRVYTAVNIEMLNFH